MLARAVELLADSHICQLNMLAIAEYIVFIDRICNVWASLANTNLAPEVDATAWVKLIKCLKRQPAHCIIGSTV